MPSEHVRVVGMTFRPGYPEAILWLSEQLTAATASSIRDVSGWDDLDPDETPGPKVLLVRNPDNPFDANAIEVHIPALGRRQFVGHIPADLAARWAARLDADPDAYEACVTSVPITPEHIDRPGLEIRVRFPRS